MKSENPTYRRDGFQHGLWPDSGCHNYTILKRGKAHGASFCIEQPEDQLPTEEAILARIAEKEALFGGGK